MNQDEFNKVLLSKPHCNLGKNGITDEFISHVRQLLKRYKIIKIKMLKSIATKSNTKSMADQISQATDSYVIDVRGKSIIISKQQIKKKN